MNEPAAHPGPELLWAPDAATLGHVASCARCQFRQAELAQEQQDVAALLAGWARGLDEPLDMPQPAGVTAQVEQALDREVAGRASAAPAQPPAERADQSRPRWVLTDWLAAAAVVAVALLGAGLVLPRLVDTSDPVAAELATSGVVADDEQAATDEQAVGTAEGAAGADADPSAPSLEGREVPVLPAALLAAAEALTADPGSAGTLDDCGRFVAAQVGEPVVAAARVPDDAGGGVLVVITDGGARQAWWLPTCAATVDEAWGAGEL